MIKKIRYGFVLLFLLVWSSVGLAQQYREGKHYQRVPFEIIQNEVVENLKQEYKGKTLVVEFYSYGCHWCHQLEPSVNAWLKEKKPKEVVFLRFPVIFQSSWKNLSKAYYTADALGKLTELQPILFDAVQSGKMKTSSSDELFGLFSKEGVTQDEFEKTFSSFSVEQQSELANKISMAFRITSIPTFIVLGKTDMMTSERMAGSATDLFQVINLLAADDKLASSSGKHGN